MVCTLHTPSRGESSRIWGCDQFFQMDRVTGEVICVSSPNTDEGSEPHREVGADFFDQGLIVVV